MQAHPITDYNGSFLLVVLIHPISYTWETWGNLGIRLTENIEGKVETKAQVHQPIPHLGSFSFHE